MHRARSSALILLAEIATQAELPLATRIAIGMSRDALLFLDEVEPVGRPGHSHEPPTVDGVVQLLENASKRSPREAGRLRIAALWLRGGDFT